jgi:cytidine deaminase
MPVKKIDIHIEVREYLSEKELPQEDRVLLRKASEASMHAYAPYSNFSVGAAARLESGEMICGNNQENAAYPSGICAERTVVYYTGANHGGEKIEAMAVSCANNKPEDLPAAPCGACRQALLEYEIRQASPIRIILGGKTGKVLVADSVSDLLPLAFRPADLGK